MTGIFKSLPKLNKIFKSKQKSNTEINTINCPIELQWIISEKCLATLKEKPGEFFESDIFDGYGFQYSLTIYPNGDGKTKIGQTRIFLRIYFQNDVDKIEAEYLIKIESAKYSNKMKHIFEKSKGWGVRCCSTEKLFDPKKKFIVNGMLVIRVEGILKVTTKKIKEEKLMDLRDFGVCLWNRNSTKDFTIIVDGKDIQVHKIVLSTRSPVFDAMFESTMKEATENRMFITDFRYEIVKAAIQLCYHQNLTSSLNLSTNDKMELLLFFDKYDIQHPKDQLEDDLIDEITSLNVCKLSNYAILSNCANLQRHCSNFLRQCLKAFVPISDFDELDKDFALNVLKNSFHHVSKTI